MTSRNIIYRHLRCALTLLTTAISAASISHAEGGMKMDMRGSHGSMDMKGMAMNVNSDRLPRGCPKISKDISITVHAGHKYAIQGQMFGYDKHVWQVPKCARVTVKFFNEDHVRHQWMMHGLPRYIYAKGMFHLEANGGTSRTGTFIVPNSDKTYLVHCDMAQHMEKGLKGEFKVGRGSGDLPSVPTISDVRIQADLAGVNTLPENLLLLLSSLIGLGGIWWVVRANGSQSS